MIRYGNWNSWGGRAPAGATGGMRNGRRWNTKPIDGADLGDVVVVRRGYEADFVRCKAAGHEYPVNRATLRSRIKASKPLACRDCEGKS